MRQNNIGIDMIASLAVWILAFAHVVAVDDCSNVPLISRSLLGRSRDGTIHTEPFRSWDGRNPSDIPSDFWLRKILELLIADEVQDQLERISLASEYGWNVYISSIGDDDPARINCELLFLKKGVPTNMKTKERKYRIVDTERFKGSVHAPYVVESGSSSSPRCISPVVKRDVLFSSRDQEFWQTIRFQIDESGSGLRSSEKSKFSLVASYRQMQDARWRVIPTIPCDHERNVLRGARLDLGVATVGCFT
jgi:hypothetical protein